MIDFGVRQTEQYYNSLKKCLELLGKNPKMGIDAFDVQVGYRRFQHQSHVIFYRIHSDGVIIVRILHKRMDIDKHFEE
jgi:toxin ParE1/3/4